MNKACNSCRSRAWVREVDAARPEVGANRPVRCFLVRASVAARRSTQVLRADVRALWILPTFLTGISACQPAAEVPTSADHPILGEWRMTSKDGSCSETYRFRSDATVFVTSGEEIAEIQYGISSQPSAKGFYRWTHKVARNNGRKDCSGKVMKPGDAATWYIQLDSSKQALIMCREESTNACFGPLRRNRSGDS